MLEMSVLNLGSSNQKSLQKKKIAFKSNTANAVQVQKSNAVTPQAASAPVGAKNLINIIPNSYVDEVAAAALIAGLAVLSHGRGKKLNSLVSENTKMGQTINELTGKIDDLSKKAASMGTDDVKKIVQEETSDVVKHGELDQKITNKANEIVKTVKTDMGIETDAKIAAQMAKVANNSDMYTETVEINGANMRLATIYWDSKSGGETLAKLETQLQTEATRRILGVGKGLSQVPKDGKLAIITSEYKGYASTGGMSAVPKEVAENLTKMLDGNQDMSTNIYLPLYLGRLDKNTTRVLQADGTGKFRYVEYAKNKEGVMQEKLVAKLDKVHTFTTPIYTDKGKTQETVNVFVGKDGVTLKGSDKYLEKLSDDAKDMFASKPAAENIGKAVNEGAYIDDNGYRFIKLNDGVDESGNKKTKTVVQKLVDVIFVDNGNGGKFDLNVASDKATNIYNNNAISTGETERFIYFNKFLYELFLDDRKPKSLKEPDAIIGNDWQTGALSALMRLLTPAKKAYGEIDPVKADKIYNTPNITIFHNAALSGGVWHSQEKMLNVMFGDKAATIAKNAHVRVTNAQTPGLDAKLWNGLSEGHGSNNNVGINPQMMALCYSDYITPVSKGYANEIAENSIYGGARTQLFNIRAKKGAFEVQSVLESIIKDNNIEVSDKSVLKKPTMLGITNGCDSGNNTLTTNKAKEIAGNIEFAADRLKPYSKGQDALKWHNDNKQVAIDVLKRDMEIAHKTNGATNPMKIEKPQEVDISDITVDTPIFVSAGRIVDQKGIDIWAKSIEKFYETYPKDRELPVFYLQGVGDPKFKEAFMGVKEKIAQTNPKAAKRMLYAGLFSEPGRFDMAKVMADFSVMPSWFEPCGLSHKEIGKFSGALTIVNKTGGLPDDLTEGVNVFISKFNPQRDQIDVNAENFAKKMQEALDMYADKNKLRTGIETMLNSEFDWARENGPIYQYTNLLEKLGVFNHQAATAKI